MSMLNEYTQVTALGSSVDFWNRLIVCDCCQTHHQYHQMHHLLLRQLLSLSSRLTKMLTWKVWKAAARNTNLSVAPPAKSTESGANTANRNGAMADASGDVRRVVLASSRRASRQLQNASSLRRWPNRDEQKLQDFSCETG